jgi:hypothetical protein
MRSGDGNPGEEPFLFTSPDLLRVMSDTLNQSETFPKKCLIRTLQIHATRLMPIILDQDIFWPFAMFIQQPFNENTETKMMMKDLPKPVTGVHPFRYAPPNLISARRFLQA